MSLNRRSLEKLGVIGTLAILTVGCVQTPEQKEAKFIVRGKDALAKKDFGRAILEFKNAVQVGPNSAEASYQLGLAHLAGQEYGEAVSYLQRATRLDPKHVGAQLKLSELMATSRDRGILQQASDRLQSVLLSSADNPDALNRLAVVEMRLGKPDEALSHLQQALQKFPTHLGAAVTLARFDLSRKDFPAAEETLKRIVEQAPDSIESKIALGRLYIFLRRLPEGEAQFRRALGLDPKNTATLYDLGSLLAQTGRKEEAAQLFEKLASFPGNHSLYARYLFDSGQRQEAVSRFEELERKNPDDRQLRSVLVLAYLALNRIGDAQNLLTKALKANPKDVEALEQRAQIRLLAGNVKDAEADLREVLSSTPDSANAHYLISKCLLAKGSFLSYQQELGEALRLEPTMLRARIDLSQALRIAKGPKAALDVMDQAQGEQKITVAAIVERNWSLIALQDEGALRKGIDQGLKLARDGKLLLQDGLLKLRQKDYPAARVSLEEALRAEPEDLRIVETLAGSYLAQKQIPKSVKCVRDYASARPKSAKVQYFLGTWLLRTADLAGARTAFEATRSIDPAFSQADLALAKLDFSQNNTVAARERLTKLLSASKRNAQAHLLLATIEYKEQNTAAAIEHLREVVDAEPGNASALNDLAYLLANHANKPDEALKFAQQAKEAQPSSSAVSDTIGWVYYKKGLYDTAVKHLETAISSEDTALYRYHLAMAYQKAGHIERARQSYRRALAMNANLPEGKEARELIGSSVTSQR